VTNRGCKEGKAKLTRRRKHDDDDDDDGESHIVTHIMHHRGRVRDPLLSTSKREMHKRTNDSRPQLFTQLQSHAGFLFTILGTLRGRRAHVIEIEPFPCVFGGKWGPGGATGSTPAPWPLCRAWSHVDKVCKVELLLGSTQVSEYTTTAAGSGSQRRQDSVLAGWSRWEEISGLSLAAHVDRGGRVGKVEQEIGVVLVLCSFVVPRQTSMLRRRGARR